MNVIGMHVKQSQVINTWIMLKIYKINELTNFIFSKFHDKYYTVYKTLTYLKKHQGNFHGSQSSELECFCEDGTLKNSTSHPIAFWICLAKNQTELFFLNCFNVLAVQVNLGSCTQDDNQECDCPS